MAVFLVLIASGLLTMLSLSYILCKHLTTPRRQEVWIYWIPRFILVYPYLSVMKILLDEAFRVRGAHCLSFTMKRMIDNIYVSVGSTVFRQ